VAEAPYRDPGLIVSFRRGDTPAVECSRLADFLYEYFMTPSSPGAKYGRYQYRCSIIALPDTFEEYLAGAAGAYTRRKLRRAARDGYRFAEIDPNDHLDDIFAINTSLKERQGREMDEAYRNRPEPWPPPRHGCPRHREVWYGVLKDRLVAYTWVYQVGEMCLFNRILGHGAHLDSGIMYTLVAGSIADLMPAGLRYAMYERHTSGSEGLRYFKEKLGFRSYWVDWQLADEEVHSTRGLFGERSALSPPTPVSFPSLVPSKWPVLARRAVRKVRRALARPGPV
jgi:hypothetical protein